MLTQEIELGVLDLKDKKKKIVKLKEDEICWRGFRIDLDGKIVRGVPRRNQGDCYRFCYKDTCDSL
jgi:hypothetical protein